MFTTTSTNIPVEMLPPANTTMKSVCSVAIILSCLTTNYISASLSQRVVVEGSSLFSADLAGESFYNNGNISYSWDGVSVMSVDRSRSLLRIREIESLGDNWNGNGASVFSDKILAAARNAIYQLSVQPSILPTARDSIQFEYENVVGDYLEFEIFEDGQIKKFYYGHDGNAETAFISVSEMNMLVNDFYGRNI